VCQSFEADHFPHVDNILGEVFD